MAISRLSLGIASTAGTLSLLFIAKNLGHASSESSEQKSFGMFKTFSAWMTHDEEILRKKGYSPENLYQSGQAAFAAHQNIKARMQFATMLRFTPQAVEAPLYEMSGDTLEEKGYHKKAVKHWTHAFNHQHRPYAMNEKLGHYLLKHGKLRQSQTVFEHQVSAYPESSVAHNELGVTRLMRALRQKQFEKFENHKIAALGLFEKSSELNPTDYVPPLNRKTASLLKIGPVYGSTHTFLTTRPDTATPILDAVLKDLELYRFETRSSVGSGVTIGTDAKGLPTVDPTIVSHSYEVPRYANEAALVDLTKLKSEEYERMHTVARTP